MDQPVRVLAVEPESLTPSAASLSDVDDRLDVVVTSTPERALDTLSEGGFDCVLSAYELPDGNGLDVLSTLKETHPDLPVVFWPAHGSERLASDALAAGAADYLPREESDRLSDVAERIQRACADYRDRQQQASAIQRYEMLLADISDTVLMTDENGAFSYVCPNVSHVFGYSAGEVTDLGTVDALFEEPLFEPGELDERGEIENIETEITTAEGDRRTVLVTVKQVDIPVGTRLYTVRDITERERRKRERRQYERMVNTMQESACIYDEDARFEAVNEYLADFYDTTPDDLVGEKSNLVPRINAQYDGDAFGELFTGEREELTGEVAGEFPEGGYQVLDYRLTPLIVDGDVEGVVGVTREVTEQREYEQQLEETNALLSTLFEALPVGVLAEDESRQVLAANERLFELFDFKGTPSDIVGADCERLAEDAGGILADTEAFIAEIEHRIETRNPVDDVEFVLEDDRTFALSYRPLELPDGNGHLWMYRDVTEQKERERTLKRERDRFEEFANVVSHDLRNPLHVARGRLELASEDCDSEHHETIVDALDRMDTLIDDLLTLAREDDQVNEREHIDLASLVESCWRNVDSVATLQVAIDRTVSADRNRLRQLFENLFRNAVEHGSAGGDIGASPGLVRGSSAGTQADQGSPTRGVTIRIGELEGGFYVADDGPGIPPDVRERVFEAGYSTTETGTGFGLSIVEQVATAHGWDVNVTESDAGGARFEFTGVEWV
ncbi:Signal transduction histidine kinase with PAS and REC domains [Halapricum desulfuricans]|uniref:histidine kinase n=1 Tax=Halapricum desulfuricans TaxID=2841257 RepID=A0A897NGP0_9EURY|nr:PAS domain S-box protein [Halapricum desulfuricans]QSG11882.1 Signal transduction histidine kinase with PAS and REC domains [Halapricum desulfuricans]